MRKNKADQHIINWNPNAHTVIRRCAEQYTLGTEYKSNVDPKEPADIYRPFKLPKNKSVVVGNKFRGQKNEID